MTVLRNLNWPADEPALRDLDTSFAVERVFRLETDGRAATLVEVPAVAPLRKTYPLAAQLDELPSMDWAQVATERDAIVGLAALRLAGWNRRAELHHLYVAPEARGRGIGRSLLSGATDAARRLGARVLWTETQTTNPAAVRFYERHGFAWCGFDASLYDPDQVTPGEVALFFALDLRG